jgi:hypothetical protein
MLVPGGGGGAAPDFNVIGQSMADFAAGAAAGAFAVNESGGDALLAAIRGMAAWVDNNIRKLRSLAQEPGLGTSHGAETMKPFVAQVATDDRGFLPMLEKFRQSLQSAEQGIIDAMGNYSRMDAGGAVGLRA